METIVDEGFNYKGYYVAISYDELPEDPRDFSETTLYGYDDEKPIGWLLDKDGNVKSKCKELKGKWCKIVSKTVHSSVSLYLGEPKDKWGSVFGIIAVEKSRYNEEDANKLFKTELKCLERYLNEDLYQFVISDKNNCIVDSCGNFYDTKTAINEAMASIDSLAESKKEIISVEKEITKGDINAALQILKDNGIENNKCETVLQAIGYALLDAELFPSE